MKNPFIKTSGRSSQSNQVGRFEKQSYEEDLSHYEWIDADDVNNLKTQVYEDTTKSIVTSNDSPDLGFSFTLNPYRGCEHGCVYCYARPTHEYLGFSAGLDFESKIFVKKKAPELLRKKFMSKSWKPAPIFMAGITDCYQPLEREFEITRKCLEVFNEFNNPVNIVTKNFLVTRDLDILKEMAKKNLVSVSLSVTSLDAKLARTLEPRTSTPQARLKALKLLTEAGVPTNVMVAPVVPGLTDHEMPAILKACANVGVQGAAYTVMRLPYSVKDIFSEWINANYPEKADRVLNYVRDLRGGKLYDASFETRMRGVGEKADNIEQVFKVFSKKYGLNKFRRPVTTALFRRPGDQLNLLDPQD